MIPSFFTDLLYTGGHLQKILWVRRRASGRSRPPQKAFIAQKWTKINVFGQNSAGGVGGSFSRVVSAFKTLTVVFCNPKKFFVMFRRPPATYGRLKSETFLQKQ